MDCKEHKRISGSNLEKNLQCRGRESEARQSTEKSLIASHTLTRLELGLVVCKGHLGGSCDRNVPSAGTRVDGGKSQARKYLERD